MRFISDEKEIRNTAVLNAVHICAANSKEEAIGKAIECSKKIWPIESRYGHSVNAEELSEEVINEVYRLYPVGEFYE